MSDTRPQRTWFGGPDEDAWVFLTHAPITFGHSQLIVRHGGEEAEGFDTAAGFIRRAIGIFSAVFQDGPPDGFQRLAELTRTCGRYRKTLVLRASGAEERSHYKVHLLPYFDSHAGACADRHRAIHGLPADAPAGGLLGWVGERETIVDGWVMGPYGEQLNDYAIDALGLAKLAELLKREWA